MRYFLYSSGRNTSQYQLTKIFLAVQKMENLAKARYGGQYQDALDAALFHIIENYDESLCDDEDGLERYAASIVNTIYRSNHKRELVSEVVLGISSDKESMEEAITDDPYEGVGENTEAVFESDVVKCMEDLFPNFLKDYELFVKNEKAERKGNYHDIYSTYSNAVVCEAVNRMSVEVDKARYLAGLCKTCKLRSFAADRYKASMDPSIRFTGFVNGIAVCTYASARVKRNVYRVYLMEFIDDIVDKFYTGENAVGYRNICGHDVYCSLSGKELVGEEALRKSLEHDILGALLAKVIGIKVVDYCAGRYLIVSSSKPEEYGLMLKVFGNEMILQISRLSVKKVVL